MVDCSWLKWSIEHHDPLTERLARESKPLTDRLAKQEPFVFQVHDDGVSKVDKSPRDWKWCIIAAHSALQGALVCILSGTAEIGALREDLQSAWLEWFDNRKGKEPDTKLADFKTLLKWAGNSSRMVHADEGPPLKLSATQIRDLHKLHYFRNQFAHYAPMGWAIEKAGLPRIVLAASETAEHLMLSYFRVRMHLSGNQIRRIECAAKAVRVALG
jgi:hypothetical protein